MKLRTGLDARSVTLRIFRKTLRMVVGTLSKMWRTCLETLLDGLEERSERSRNSVKTSNGTATELMMRMMLEESKDDTMVTTIIDVLRARFVLGEIQTLRPTELYIKYKWK